jgi:hypothetical protein
MRVGALLAPRFYWWYCAGDGGTWQADGPDALPSGRSAKASGRRGGVEGPESGSQLGVARLRRPR